MTAALARVSRPTTPRSFSLPSAATVAPALGLVALVALWIVGGRAGWASGMIVTPAEAVEPIFGENSQIYRRATVATATSAAKGFMIGGVIAIVAAVVAAGVPSMRRSIARLATIANSAPWVAVAPCMLVVLGRERGPVAVAALAMFFVVFVSTAVGLGAAAASSHDVLRALGAPRRRHISLLQLPASLPLIADGLKLGAPAALAGAVFGEWYGAPRGLGVLLIGAMQSGRAERLWAASLLAAGCGLVAYAAFGLLQRWLSTRYGTTATQTTPAMAIEDRGRGAVLRELLTVAIITSVLVFAWWAWIEMADISPLVVPRPSRVWSELVGAPGDYLSASLTTLYTSGVALVLGSVLGLAAAALAARSRLLGGMLVPAVVVLAATPLVALLPLFARIFGYEPGTVRILAAVMVFFPVFVYTRSGLQAASAAATDALWALGTSANRRFLLLRLPAAVPHIVSGFRLAAGSAVVAAVVGETLIGRAGLGYVFARAYRVLELPRAFGAAIVIVAISLLVFAAAGAVERVVHDRWT